jgi:hypothetical protein
LYWVTKGKGGIAQRVVAQLEQVEVTDRVVGLFFNGGALEQVAAEAQATIAFEGLEEVPAGRDHVARR